MDKKVILEQVASAVKYVAKATVVCAGVGLSVLTTANEINKGLEFFSKK
jgi:hypothetical protein|nr:MAG TPA: hypothetical protein [Caudoviricetes sp.]